MALIHVDGILMLGCVRFGQIDLDRNYRSIAARPVDQLSRGPMANAPPPNSGELSPTLLTRFELTDIGPGDNCGHGTGSLPGKLAPA